MSFFSEIERKTDLAKAGTPSPFDYNPIIKHQQHFARAPFGSTATLKRTAKPPKMAQQLPEQTISLNDLGFEAEQSRSSMFKSGSQRFLQAQTIQPGPGEYVLDRSLITKNTNKLKTQGIGRLRMEKTGVTPPSIPTDHLGYKESDNKELKKVELLKRNPPHPGSYEIRTDLQGKGVVSWKADHAFQAEANPHPGPGWYEPQRGSNEKKVTSCFTSSTDRFGAKTDLRRVKAPGPGSYHPNFQHKSQHSANRQGNFNSKTARFPVHQQDRVGPATYFTSKKQSASATGFRRHYQEDNHVPTKKSIFEVKNDNPGPNHYQTNSNCINFELQRDILRKHSMSVFPTQKRQIFENSQQNPGPGSYEVDVKKQCSPKSGRKRKAVSVIKPKQPELTPSPVQYYNFHNTIVDKVRQINSKLTLVDEKPFNSNTERFKHYAPSYEIEETPSTLEMQDSGILTDQKSNKRVKRLVMTTIKVRVPFGISTGKFEEKVTEYSGPDYYDKSAAWVKSTFNVKGKLC